MKIVLQETPTVVGIKKEDHLIPGFFPYYESRTITSYKVELSNGRTFTVKELPQMGEKYLITIERELRADEKGADSEPAYPRLTRSCSRWMYVPCPRQWTGQGHARWLVLDQWRLPTTCAQAR